MSNNAKCFIIFVVVFVSFGLIKSLIDSRSQEDLAIINEDLKAYQSLLDENLKEYNNKKDEIHSRYVAGELNQQQYQEKRWELALRYLQILETTRNAY